MLATKAIFLYVGRALIFINKLQALGDFDAMTQHILKRLKGFLKGSVIQ